MDTWDGLQLRTMQLSSNNLVAEYFDKKLRGNHNGNGQKVNKPVLGGFASASGGQGGAGEWRSRAGHVDGRALQER
jgi:hypothetical protein